MDSEGRFGRLPVVLGALSLGVRTLEGFARGQVLEVFKFVRVSFSMPWLFAIMQN